MKKKGLRSIDIMAMATVLLLVFCQVALTSSVTLKWTNTADDGSIGQPAAKNELYISRGDSAGLVNNPYSKTRVANVPIPSAPGTCQQVTVGGLTCDSVYYARMKTLDSDSLYAWGNICRFVAPDTIAPGPITTLMIGTCP
jgi:hypothetical protein